MNTALCSTMRVTILLIGGVPVFPIAALGQEPPTRAEAAQALKKAVTFFRDKVSADGGYLWRYSEDLSLREGEEKATATQAWLQPPGTPSVGEAFLAAYERTKDPLLLDAATHTARASVNGQLHSGCWA